MTEFPKIGFVVIGRNEGDRLLECLASLAPQGAPVVYSDSASTDDSVGRAKAAGALVCELDASAPMNAGRGRAEGFDLLLAHYPDREFVQFVDGDCLLTPEWIPRGLQFLNATKGAAVACGLRFERNPGGSLYNRMCDEEWRTPIGEAAACGGDALFRVEAYRSSGGFRSDLMAGEEPELCTRIREKGWSIWRLDVRMAEHDARIYSLRQWLRRSIRGGYGYAQVWNATKGRTDRLYGRQMASALTWGAGVPLASVGLAFLLGRPSVLLIAPLLFALQVFRIAERFGKDSLFSWQRAMLLMTSKVAETFGVIRFAAGNRRATSIAYKQSEPESAP